jgi:hypothetical protein
MIPVAHARKLRDLAPDPAYVEYPCGHNNFPDAENEADYRDRIRKFLVDAGIIEQKPSANQ